VWLDSSGLLPPTRQCILCSASSGCIRPPAATDSRVFGAQYLAATCRRSRLRSPIRLSRTQRDSGWVPLRRRWPSMPCAIPGPRGHRCRHSYCPCCVYASFGALASGHQSLPGNGSSRERSHCFAARQCSVSVPARLNSTLCAGGTDDVLL
jgi:hypothetical protein